MARSTRGWMAMGQDFLGRVHWHRMWADKSSATIYLAGRNVVPGGGHRRSDPEGFYWFFYMPVLVGWGRRGGTAQNLSEAKRLVEAKRARWVKDRRRVRQAKKMRRLF